MTTVRNAKRSVALNGRNTSISLEKDFWDALNELARDEALTVPKLIARIKSEEVAENLSSSVRVFLLRHYREGMARRRL